MYQIDNPCLDYVKAVILEKNTLFTDQVARNPPPKYLHSIKTQKPHHKMHSNLSEYPITE